MPSAMENNGTPPGISEAHLLAPWYAMGKLDEAELRELEEFARQDPEFVSFLEETKHEAQATVLLNESLGEPSEAVWESLSRSIELVQQGPASSRFARLTGAVKDTARLVFGLLTAPQLQAVAAFLLALCVIQAGVIAYLSLQAPAKYSVASGTAVRAKQAKFIVTFSDTATIAEAGKALDDAGAIIVDGPNADGLYHLGLRDDTVNTKDQAYQVLRASPAVKLILSEK